MNKKIINLWEENQKIKDNEISWILEMIKRLKESRKHIEKIYKNQYNLKCYLKIYSNLLIFFDLRLKELRNRIR